MESSSHVRGHGVRFAAFASGKQLKTGAYEFLAHLVIAVVAYIAVLIPFYFLIATRFEEMGVQFNVGDIVKSFVGMATRMLDPVEKTRILESMKPSHRAADRKESEEKKRRMDALDKQVEASNSKVRWYAYIKLLQVLLVGAVMVAIFYTLARRSYAADAKIMPDAHEPESLMSMIKSNAILALVILLTQTLFSLGFATWVRIVDKSELMRSSADYVQAWADGTLKQRQSESSSSPPPTLSGMRSGASSSFSFESRGQTIRRRQARRT